ncbi:membrane-bound lytic murein transglycosylase MltF [Psychromonas sp. 14N.309.X.WAT.B.A12]|uniref:membrane-bound lytic murein transglycosylase MltF n=1 Tax=Psychromonas sp. 14N.309.X.WAT.B.A12 TaxID=2998322 RepID=UPI0025AF4F09|nr:membrane-bound lytic murein transglycosylase MltF [Psychromonas sp. 14N.309.X.WAT.B.A12]MDN2664719.1 membrane-bound lytic murein transglycosylase MltF [Psychromonas sp. 14N.309.X.WAT.B.A12]
MNKPVFLTSTTIKFKLFLSAIFIFLLTACNPVTPTTDLEEMQARQTLIMGTMNSALTYSFDGDNYSGLDYELGKKFAKYLNLKLIIKEYDDFDSLFSALEDNEIDFAGAGLTLTPKRAEKYRSSPPYYYLSQTLVYHKGTYRPRDISDIDAPVNVLKGSSHEENIKASLIDYPDLVINVLENEDQESLLQKVAQKEIQYAIVDSTTLAQKQRYYPSLAEAFTIYEKQPVAWLIRKAQDDSFYSAMIEFMGNQYNSGTIAKVEEKYFGHIGDFDYVDTRIFLKRIDSRLPKYEALFKQYATPEVPWLLLASVSYQESHWNPKATSPTGVRGMMMLTLDTAKFVGVKNRVNAEQSIQGGAKYLTQLIKRLPESIPEDERIWFALASYNIGLGHLLDVRRITKMREQNPDSWADVKENLPLLHERKWYTKTRYGYARGREAKHYVDNIREYLETLTWHAQEQEKALKLAEEQKAEEARLAAIAKAEEERLAAIELEKQKKLEEEKLAEAQRQAAIEAENQARIAADKQAEEAKQAALEAAEKAEAKAAAKLAEEQKEQAEAAVKLAEEQKAQAEAAAKLAAEQKAQADAAAKLAEEQTQTEPAPKVDQTTVTP